MDRVGERRREQPAEYERHPPRREPCRALVARRTPERRPRDGDRAEERRRELVKLAKKVSEESKVGVRNARRDAMELLKVAEKDEHLSEDMRKGAEADVQKLTDKYVAEVDKIIGEKEKDILTV